MANRNFNPVQSLERGNVSVYLGVDIGAAGAPTAKKVHGADISRSGAGTYVIALIDAYTSFLGMDLVVVGVAGDYSYQITSVDVANKTLTFVTKTAGVVADPANGDEFFIKLELKNTSVVY